MSVVIVMSVVVVVVVVLAMARVRLSMLCVDGESPKISIHVFMAEQSKCKSQLHSFISAAASLTKAAVW